MEAKVKFQDRPTCSCGVKMKLIKYVGYYDEFKYWRCDNCNLNENLDDYKEDFIWGGQYV